MTNLTSPSFKPLYEQIKILITQSLVDGEWRPGDVIPSEIDLAQRYKVSQGTVRKAIDELADDNILNRRQGKGTFVTSHSPEVASTRFLRIARDDGVTEAPYSILLSLGREKVTAPIAGALELRIGSAIYRIRRLLAFQGQPQILDDIQIPAVLFKGLEEAMLRAHRGSLYSFFESRFGVAMIRAEEHLKATPADVETAAHLGIREASPILQVDRVAFTYGDRPVEWRRGLCNTDRFSYVTEMS